MTDVNATERPAKSRVILVVDDDRVALREMADYMENFGHKVLCAASGGEAIAMATREHPDLVLCDINMPGLDGLRVVDILGTLDKRMVLILISGDVDALRRAREEGIQAAAMLMKPMSLPLFRQYVETLT